MEHKKKDSLLQNIYQKNNLAFEKSLTPEVTKTTNIVDTILLNVNGTKFEISKCTFTKLEANLMLAGAQCTNSGSGRVEFFLERHVGSFTAVLHFFQTGDLHLPSEVCPSVFGKELSFWGVDWKMMKPCCLRSYASFVENEETLRGFNRSQSEEGFQKMPTSGWARVRMQGWAILDKPSSSIWAKIYLAIATMFVILSIFVLAASTHKAFSRSLETSEWEEFLSDAELDYFGDQLYGKGGRRAFYKDDDYYNDDDDDEYNENVGDTTDATATSGNATKQKPGGHSIGKRSIRRDKIKPRTTLNAQGKPLAKSGKTFNKLNENTGKKIMNFKKRSPNPTSLDLKKKMGTLMTKTNPFLKDADFKFDLSEVDSDTLSQVKKLAANPDLLQLLTLHFISSLKSAINSNNHNKENNHYRYRRAAPGPNSTDDSTSNTTTNSSNSTAFDSSECYIMSAEDLKRYAQMNTGLLMSILEETSNVELPDKYRAVVNWLNYLEMVCIAFFTCEYILRLIFAPNRLRHIFSFYTSVDFISLATMYVVLILQRNDPQLKYTSSYVDIINNLQMVRVIRFFRLVKDIVGFRVLIFSFRTSFKDLMLLALYIFMSLATFSSLVYYMERDNMKSIPDAAWWVIVTMTTVGYGDMSPVTLQGKLVGCACALSGVLLIAVTVPVFVNNFLMFYEHAKVSIMIDPAKMNVPSSSGKNEEDQMSKKSSFTSMTSVSTDIFSSNATDDDEKKTEAKIQSGQKSTTGMTRSRSAWSGKFTKAKTPEAPIYKVAPMETP